MIKKKLCTIFMLIMLFGCLDVTAAETYETDIYLVNVLQGEWDLKTVPSSICEDFYRVNVEGTYLTRLAQAKVYFSPDGTIYVKKLFCPVRLMQKENILSYGSGNVPLREQYGLLSQYKSISYAPGTKVKEETFTYNGEIVHWKAFNKDEVKHSFDMAVYTIDKSGAEDVIAVLKANMSLMGEDKSDWTLRFRMEERPNWCVKLKIKR